MSEPGYDPDLRRDTPLALKLKARIEREGAIPISAFMDACLNDGEHGYYRTQTAIGRDGDFITSPEISQVFGELIGVWCAVVWQQMGAPKPCKLIELGPGRGTLMRDALRASRIVPGFADSVQLCLVETNPVLQAAQRATLGDHAARTAWHAHATEIDPGPSILIANEFLDTLPISQYVKDQIGWCERGVLADAAGKLQFGLLDAAPVSFIDHLDGRAPPGAVVERRQTMDVSFALQRLGRGGPLAALFIDYGHAGARAGDTLQAIRRQHYEHPLTSPGEADLTALVEFEAFAAELHTWELASDGPVTQAEFLGALGTVERASRLMAANPRRAAEIEAGVARLMAPTGMGGRFKVLGVRSPELAVLPGLEGPRSLDGKNRRP